MTKYIKGSDELWEKCGYPGIITEEDLIYREKDITSNQIQTSFRYLDFMEDFFEKYNDKTDGRLMANTDFDEWIAGLRGVLHWIIREER